MVKTLVRENGVDARDAQGQTPLMLAAAFGSPEAVRLLIANGADVSATSNGGVTALHWAAMDVGKTRLLLDAGADVHAVSQVGRTPLLVAASANGTAEAVRLLLARGASVNAPDTLGVTPLLAAASVDDEAVAHVLLGHGANPHGRAQIGQAATPLMAAALNGNADLVRTLLGLRSDLHAASEDRVHEISS